MEKYTAILYFSDKTRRTYSSSDFRELMLSSLTLLESSRGETYGAIVDNYKGVVMQRYHKKNA